MTANKRKAAQPLASGEAEGDSGGNTVNSSVADVNPSAFFFAEGALQNSPIAASPAGVAAPHHRLKMPGGGKSTNRSLKGKIMTDNFTVLSNPVTHVALVKDWQSTEFSPPIAMPTHARYLIPVEITALFQATRNDEHAGYATLLACVLLSGIPAQDWCTAEWEMYDDENGIIHLLCSVTDKYAAYTLNQPTRDLLRRWESQSASTYSYLFMHYGSSVNIEDAELALERIGKRAGLPNLRFDDLQRTFEYFAIGFALCDTPTQAFEDEEFDEEPFIDELTGQLHPAGF